MSKSENLNKGSQIDISNYFSKPSLSFSLEEAAILGATRSCGLRLCDVLLDRVGLSDDIHLLECLDG